MNLLCLILTKETTHKRQNVDTTTLRVLEQEISSLYFNCAQIYRFEDIVALEETTDEGRNWSEV